MDSKKSKLFGALLFLPLAVLLVGTSAAQDADSDEKKADQSSAPDLVITEDTQIALRGRTGKAVTGSCKYEDPLWEGKIALKNIGGAPVEVEPEPPRHDRLSPVSPPDRLSPVPTNQQDDEDDRPYHIRVYVPNNIELQAQARLSHTLDEFGQELLEIEIGRNKNKCRNYDAPPVFDENLSGRPGPIPVPDTPSPYDGYSWRIKKIQHVLIQKGYPVHPDGDFGPESARAVLGYFRDRHIPPPPGIHSKPLAPETVSFLLEALAVGGEEDVDTGSTGTVGGGDECKRGVNLVPIYLEVDPDRRIKNENRSNNRVQFTVAIDCSNVAR
jgi:hypothetical protein